MIKSEDIRPRHLVPRWTSVNHAIRSGIFGGRRYTKNNKIRSLIMDKNFEYLSSEFDHKLSIWTRHRDINDAEELIEVAIVCGQENNPEVLNAAAFVLNSKEELNLAKNTAKLILENNIKNSNVWISPNNSDLFSEIRRWKHRINLYPKDALGLVELSLCYANLGQNNKSEDLIKRALILAPHNRYVLRSAARFYCHVGKPDVALYELRKTPRHNLDPWLKSAELAVSNIANSKILSWKKARDIVFQNDISAIDKSELAAEIATLEFQADSQRFAMRALNLAAEHPTENTVAQIEYLSEKTSLFETTEFVQDISMAAEASARHFFNKKNISATQDACETWHKIEPFSLRPTIFGSFVSSLQGASLEQGIGLAKDGLKSNPNSSVLLNNLAVLYAYLGDLENAEKSAENSRKYLTEPDEDIVAIATEGLIYFRRGDQVNGISKYEKAMELAEQRNSYDMALRAYSFLAKEMARIDPELKPMFVNEFEKLESEFNKRNRKLPKDVELIYQEIRNKTIANKERSLDFRSFDINYF